ncbi:PA14 domain-containing protein [Spirosoma foliorum]|uniref:PA14 domain-containing protein n=1 Tax=Spirosoma foliorum TaxID=2710596 RepID=A0A7G5H1D5_9BACT|nr:PA14 domain-containing protein [Spirosoma foliorum]QMW04927.1 hypothetical protein H3H32_08525 [Spirosoma foliorum]
MFTTATSRGGTDISLAQWQSQFGRDLSSANSPVTYSSGNPDDDIKFTVNPTAASGQVSLDGTYRDPLSNVYSGQVTVGPYSSLILFNDGSAAASLRTADNPANAMPGLDYKYYEGNWSLLPDFSTLTAVKSGSVTIPNLTREANRTYNYALTYTGYVRVPADGSYTFYTASDDGSKLYIGSTLVVNNDGLQALTERSGTIGLKAGQHALTIQYLQGGGDQALTISYSGISLSKQTVPASAYYRVSTPCEGMYTLKSGNWSDVSVWSCGRLPTSTDVVRIMSDHTIVLNVDGTVKNLVYLGGTLHYSATTKLVIND